MLCSDCAHKGVCAYLIMARALRAVEGARFDVVFVKCDHYAKAGPGYVFKAVKEKVVVCPACLREFEDVEAFLRHAEEDRDHLTKFLGKALPAPEVARCSTPYARDGGDSHALG